MWNFCLWFLGFFRRRKKRQVTFHLDPKQYPPGSINKYIDDVNQELRKMAILDNDKSHDGIRTAVEALNKNKEQWEAILITLPNRSECWAVVRIDEVFEARDPFITTHSTHKTKQAAETVAAELNKQRDID